MEDKDLLQHRHSLPNGYLNQGFEPGPSQQDQAGAASDSSSTDNYKQSDRDDVGEQSSDGELFKRRTYPGRMGLRDGVRDSNTRWESGGGEGRVEAEREGTLKDVYLAACLVVHRFVCLAVCLLSGFRPCVCLSAFRGMGGAGRSAKKLNREEGEEREQEGGEEKEGKGNNNNRKEREEKHKVTERILPNTDRIFLIKRLLILEFVPYFLTFSKGSTCRGHTLVVIYL